MSPIPTPPPPSFPAGAFPGLTAETGASLRERAADYLELTKPRITALVLCTTWVGFALAAPDGMALGRLFHTLAGTALVAGGASALNQVLERDCDRRMRRTRLRPVASGRLAPEQALVFAVDMATLGLVWLALGVSRGASLVAALTLASYVLAYTPLKRKSAWCTVVGAVPGALPPVIGWVAGAGRIELGALALFGLMFAWQLPHFYAIAWLYRDDYAQGGFPMLPVGDASGRRTAAAIAGTSALLCAASFAPLAIGLGGWLYLAAAAVGGGGFLALAIAFVRERSDRNARRLFLASILYLPLVLAILAFDRSGPPGF
jgi:protoheme IX farnesyltransferase